jgi:hypothetical protein
MEVLVVHYAISFGGDAAISNIIWWKTFRCGSPRKYENRSNSSKQTGVAALVIPGNTYLDSDRRFLRSLQPEYAQPEFRTMPAQSVITGSGRKILAHEWYLFNAGSHFLRRGAPM